MKAIGDMFVLFLYIGFVLAIICSIIAAHYDKKYEEKRKFYKQTRREDK